MTDNEGLRDKLARSSEDALGQLDHARPQAVAAGRGDVLRVARGGQRGQQARDGGGVDAGRAGELVRAEVAAGGAELVEHRGGPSDGGEVSGSGTSGAWQD